VFSIRFAVGNKTDKNLDFYVIRINYRSVLLIGTVVGSCEHGDEPSRSTKVGKFLDYLRNCFFLEEKSTPWSYLVVLLSEIICGPVSWQDPHD
jgi:hypothetical protein